MRLRVAVILAVLVAVALPSPASASELIDRNASQVSLKVARNGQALLSYTVAGKRRNVLAWGAVNAIHATPSKQQVEFRLDYSGGYGTFKRDVWKGFQNACSPYDGPALHWLVTACKAPDGSYWALQAWQRMLPNYGLPAQGASAVWELRLSHWSGEVAQLALQPNWAYRRYHHLFGSLTYLGKPVHGFRSTPSGGTSTWIPSTRPTGKAGGERTASSCTSRRGNSATASTAMAAGLPGPDSATGRP